jgi:hypothetical protein
MVPRSHARAASGLGLGFRPHDRESQALTSRLKNYEQAVVVDAEVNEANKTSVLKRV